MSEQSSTVTDQSDIKTWTFNVEDLDGISHDAAQKAKKKVADETGIKYSKLVAKVVNPPTWNASYVTVYDWFDRYHESGTEVDHDV